MGAGNQAVGDRVGDGGIAQVIVPLGDRNLAGQDGGAEAVAVIDHLEEVATILIAKRGDAPVIQDQQLDSGEAIEGAR